MSIPKHCLDDEFWAFEYSIALEGCLRWCLLTFLCRGPPPQIKSFLWLCMGVYLGPSITVQKFRVTGQEFPNGTPTRVSMEVIAAS